MVGVRYALSNSINNGVQLQLMNGVNNGNTIVLPAHSIGGNDDEEGVKRAKRGNKSLFEKKIELENIDDLDKLIHEGLGLDDEEEPEEIEDDIQYKNQEVEVEYDERGSIISPLQRVFYGLIPTEIAQLSIYQDKEQLAEIIRANEQKSQERRRFLTEFEQMKNQSVSQVFALQNENIKLSKNLQQQREELEADRSVLRQEYEKRLELLQEEQNKKLRDIEKLGGLNI